MDSDEPAPKTPTAVTSRAHTHEPLLVHVIEARAGVPYEFEQHVCAACARVLDEKPLRRAAA